MILDGALQMPAVAAVSQAADSITVPASEAEVRIAKLIAAIGPNDVEMDPEFVQRWSQEGTVEFLEVFIGRGGLSNALRADGVSTGEGIDKVSCSYGMCWNLSEPKSRALFLRLTREVLRAQGMHFALPCSPWCASGTHSSSEEDWTLAIFVMDEMIDREQQKQHTSFEGPLAHDLTRSEEWQKRFGSVESPRAPWNAIRVDGCLHGVASPEEGDAGRPIRKSLRIWSTFPLQSLKAICREGETSPLKGYRAPRASDKQELPAAEARVSAVRSSEAFEGGHVEQGTKITTGDHVPAAQAQSAGAAAEACKALESERKAANEYWKELARADRFGEVYTPEECFVQSLAAEEEAPKRRRATEEYVAP